MIKPIILCILLGLVCSLSFGQALPCEELAKQIQADTTKSIWTLDSLLPDTYYCLGKYFAKRDLDKNVFLIQTYGLPEEANPCLVCRYKSYGFRFYYHDDIVSGHITKFIEGYNEISEAYLKAITGDSTFAHLNDIPKDIFNPREVLTINLANGDHQRLFDIDIINDTTILVKLIGDSLFKDLPPFRTKIAFSVTDYHLKDKKPGQTKIMSYQQITRTGFRLAERSNHKYHFKIGFDFKALAAEKEICWCPLLDANEYSYMIPLTIKP